jgi:two-component system, NarL family, nitrate/nitrite response regulator NarL
MLPSLPLDPDGTRTLALADAQPIAVEGLRALLAASPEFRFVAAVDNLAKAADLVLNRPPDLLLIDKSFGNQSLHDFLESLPSSGRRTSLIVWGNSVAEPEALRLLQSGVQGILRRAASLASILACFRTVASGLTWMDESLFGDRTQIERSPRGELTPRENQVLELVEQGLRNKEIARELGIRPGTVKIHLKHIFEKTGVRGRYGLALSGLRERNAFAVSRG